MSKKGLTCIDWNDPYIVTKTKNWIRAAKLKHIDHFNVFYKSLKLQFKLTVVRYFSICY